MNKIEFVEHISQEHSLTKTEADRILNIITTSITSALAKGSEIALIGFGKFHTSSVAARQGRNPKTGAPLTIEAYTQVKFSAGQSLKNACNGKGDTNTSTKVAEAIKNSKSDNSKSSNKSSNGKTPEKSSEGNKNSNSTAGKKSTNIKKQ